MIELGLTSVNDLAGEDELRGRVSPARAGAAAVRVTERATQAEKAAARTGREAGGTARVSFGFAGPMLRPALQTILCFYSDARLDRKWSGPAYADPISINRSSAEA